MDWEMFDTGVTNSLKFSRIRLRNSLSSLGDSKSGCKFGMTYKINNDCIFDNEDASLLKLLLVYQVSTSMNCIRPTLFCPHV